MRRLPTVSGLEYHNECYCWWNNTKYQRKGRLANSRCNTKCEGQPRKTCGGADAIEVFKIKGADMDEDTVTEYRGCYRDRLAVVPAPGYETADTPDVPVLLSRRISDIPVVDYEYTSVETCHQHCSFSGFSIFALQYGYRCQCSYDEPLEEDRADDNECNIVCPGDSSQTCGGNWHNAVYSMTPVP
ncbi:unnamed protein product [Discosporangium mesarthrocarpum]